MKDLPRFSKSLGSLICVFFIAVGAASSAPAKRPVHPTLVPIKDVAGLPQVLLIGDSISMGYTLPVRETLKGRANVHRIPQNGASSGYGVQRLDAWLGEGRWDVIHFNFGLHDAKLPPEGTRHSPPDVYEKNLRELVKRLKATGAKLIWASSTPIPNGGVLAPNRRFGDIDHYNAIAAKVMKENGVAINDLNAAIAPHVKEHQKPMDVHFLDSGSGLLAKRVSEAVVRALAD